MPPYLFDRESTGISFNPTDVVFIDRQSGLFIKASDIININTTIFASIDNSLEWEMQITGQGPLSVRDVGKRMSVTEDDILTLIEGE